MCREVCKVLVLFLCCFVSCVKDKPISKPNPLPTDKQGVYVICEGQFYLSNASLYFYRPGNDSVFGDLYQAANGQSLGDVFQSMTKIGNLYYCAINNSARLVVIDATTFKQISSIPVSSPRYITAVNDTTALVTSLYSNKIFVINTRKQSVIDSIAFSAKNTESICLNFNDIYACCWDTASNEIYSVNRQTLQIDKHIRIAGRAPHHILVDKDQMLWVLSGNQAKGKISYWTRIDPSSGAIIATYQFPSGAEPIKPVFNATRDTLYYIEANYYGGTDNNGIYKMGIHEAQLPTQPLIPAKKDQYFWGLGVDPFSGLVYVGDPKGFNQLGIVQIYYPSGVLKSQFKVGVGPGDFYFQQ